MRWAGLVYPSREDSLISTLLEFPYRDVPVALEIYLPNTNSEYVLMRGNACWTRWLVTINGLLSANRIKTGKNTNNTTACLTVTCGVPVGTMISDDHWPTKCNPDQVVTNRRNKFTNSFQPRRNTNHTLNLSTPTRFTPDEHACQQRGGPAVAMHLLGQGKSCTKDSRGSKALLNRLSAKRDGAHS